MDSRAAANLVYEDFEPSTQVIQEKDSETIVFNLPAFQKDQLRVQLTPANTLRITGSRPIADNKWRRFHVDFPVSANCNIQKISAKFEGGKLYIRLPRLIVQEEMQEKPAEELPQAHTPTPNEQTSEKMASTGDTSMPSNAVEPHDAKTGNQEDGTEKKTSIAREETEDGKENAADKEDEHIADKIAEQVAETRFQKYKNTVSSATAKLKMPRRVTNAVLVAILAVSLALYIRKLFSSCKLDVVCT